MHTIFNNMNSTCLIRFIETDLLPLRTESGKNVEGNPKEIYSMGLTP